MIDALYTSAKDALSAWVKQPGVYAALVVGFVLGAIVL
jgi:hypothetical protein